MDIDKDKIDKLMFKEILKDFIFPLDLTDAFENVKKKCDIVANIIKDVIVRNQDNVEEWEIKTSIPLLLESYHSLLQLKKTLSNILIEPKTSSSKKIFFTATEKVLIQSYVMTINLCLVDLKSFGIFLNTTELN